MRDDTGDSPAAKPGEPEVDAAGGEPSADGEPSRAAAVSARLGKTTPPPGSPAARAAYAGAMPRFSSPPTVRALAPRQSVAPTPPRPPAPPVPPPVRASMPPADAADRLAQVAAQLETTREALERVERDLAMLRARFEESERRTGELQSELVTAWSASPLRAEVDSLTDRVSKLEKQPAAGRREAAGGRGAAAKPRGLRQIRGVGPSMERSLRAAGIETIEQLAALEAGDVKALANKLGIKAERISREKWIESARALAQKT